MQKLSKHNTDENGLSTALMNKGEWLPDYRIIMVLNLAAKGPIQWTQGSWWGVAVSDRNVLVPSSFCRQSISAALTSKVNWRFYVDKKGSFVCNTKDKGYHRRKLLLCSRFTNEWSHFRISSSDSLNNTLHSTINSPTGRDFSLRSSLKMATL